MGGLFSCVKKQKKEKRVKLVQVQPVSLDGGPKNNTDYGVFCVTKTPCTTGTEHKRTTMGDECDEQPKLVASKDDVTESKVEENQHNIIEVEESKSSEMAAMRQISTSKGLAFELAVQGPKGVPVPPARLEELRRKKAERSEPTEQEIRQKLFEAERRRKQLEEERILKVRRMSRSEPAVVVEAFIERQKVLEDQQTKKMQDAVAARKNHLCDIRDRLKQKERHAKLVRQRKDLNLDEMDHPPC